MSGKYWHYTPEVKAWLSEHQDLTEAEIYPLFIAAFPSYKGIKSSTLQWHRYNTRQSHARGQGGALPLYTEREKGNRLKIKIAQPNVWILKSRWIYTETHPEEIPDMLPDDVYIFLDDDTNNYSVDNIMRVKKRVYMVCNRYGGLTGLTPDQKRYRVARATLRLATLDAAEKIDGVYRCGRTRMLREETRTRAQAYRDANRDNPEYKERRREYERKHYANLSPEKKARRAAYVREYKEKQKALQQGKD